MTRNGIERNLSISPYSYSVNIIEGIEIEFKFSSQKHLVKFSNLYDKYINKINSKLQEKYICRFDFSLLGYLECYRSIETRGFLIIMNGVNIEWLSQVKLGGHEMTLTV